ncbi:hypothetical protein K3720_15670 [Leisingera caerulea]|uniref:hypothetical protein n=1 Tax=Leisingera caerulea TaxID=506591 RepID=UPI0021A36997|nr:hypothetical protein [Leisingera caerulea]UWQ49322.1 hypothetical protein K3720_15670 [Leisingera caerulea]
MLAFGRAMFAAYQPLVCTAVLAFLTYNTAMAETELAQFFPSIPMHEDDRLSGHFEGNIDGCNITLTETSGSFMTISRFDVRHYETDPGRLNWPYVNQLSTRYKVGWIAKEMASNSSTKELNGKLRTLRVSLIDRRTLSADEIQGKSDALAYWLAEIRSGSHGTFALSNHTARYLVSNQELLVSVSVNTFMQFPAQARDMSLLAHAMYRHGLECSRN